jgi:predicted O-methyltransferase YrrM
MNITRRDVALIVAALLLLAAIAVVGRMWLGSDVSIVLAVAGPVVTLTVLLEVYRRLSVNTLIQVRRQDAERAHDYRQLEALFSVFFTINPRVPFPPLRGWASSPDVLQKLCEIVLSQKPTLVVEASSGVSTLVIAYCLRQLGRGRCVSLEHDAMYAGLSRELIARHGLTDVATIIHAPLTDVKIKGETWKWYDPSCLQFGGQIDVLFVDGPPGNVQKLSRYPALPLLDAQLSPHAHIVLDDGVREDEQLIVARWLREHSDISAEYIELEKGAYLLRKRTATPPTSPEKPR